MNWNDGSEDYNIIWKLKQERQELLAMVEKLAELDAPFIHDDQRLAAVAEATKLVVRLR